MAKRGLFGRIRDFFLGPKEEPPKPIQKTVSTEPQKKRVTRSEKTAMILNGAVNPSGDELVEKASEKNFKTTKLRPYKVQIEYYNEGNDEPNFMSIPSSKRLSTQEIIEGFQRHSEYGIEGSDEQPFNVVRAKIWMN